MEEIGLLKVMLRALCCDIGSHGWAFSSHKVEIAVSDQSSITPESLNGLKTLSKYLSTPAKS